MQQDHAIEAIVAQKRRHGKRNYSTPRKLNGTMVLKNNGAAADMVGRVFSIGPNEWLLNYRTKR